MTKTALEVSVQEAMSMLNVDLTQEEINELMSGELISIENRSVSQLGTFLLAIDSLLSAGGEGINTCGELFRYSRSGSCPGIRIVTFNERCGLYYLPPFGVRRCCED
jgi:hypothetical protein